MGKFLVILFLASVAQADDLKFTCRGNSVDYGHVAVSIETGIVGRATIRNCRMAKELGAHVGAEAKEYDTFVFSAFLGGKCEADQAGGTLKCTFIPSLGEESLEDDVGVQVQLGVTKGAVEMAAKPDGSTELKVLFKHQPTDFAKTLSIPSFQCEDGLTITAEEGVCK